MEKAINNWLKSSEYDIKTAESMFKSNRFLYVIFLCHLSVEKALKAIFISRTKKIPPKTHDLFYLIKLSNVDIPDIHRSIVAHLNEASIPTRYPEDISKLIKQYNKQVAKRYLKETKELLKWLRNQMR
jgi:HEPN domain-containing protein